MPRWPGQGPFRYPRRYGSYVDVHPSRYNWTPRVRRKCRQIVRRFPVSVNSYVRHPPPTHRWTRVSFDVWHRRGRGYYLPPKVGRRVWRYMWVTGPRWNWGYYRGVGWRRLSGWGRTPPGPPDSDPRHDAHCHWTLYV